MSGLFRRILFNRRSAALSGTRFVSRTAGPASPTGGDVTEKYGGMDLDLFRFLAEKGGPFMKDVFHPKITFISKEELHMSIPFHPSLVGNPMIPCLHGGTVATMIDHTAGFCVWASLDDPHLRCNTVDLRVDYLLPAPCEPLLFVAKVQHRSNKLGRVDVSCYDQHRKLIAIGRACFNVYKDKEDLSVALRGHLAKLAAAAASKPAEPKQH